MIEKEGKEGTMEALESVLVERDFQEVAPMEAYAEIFHLGEGYIQRKNERDEVKTNPLLYFKNNNAEHGHYRIMFEDTFQKCLEESYEYDFAILNGITYFGRRNTLSSASRIYAVIVDLDGVNSKTLSTYIDWTVRNTHQSPMPSYIALSGHNVHLYWRFTEPVEMYPEVKKQLKEFKYALIKQVWNSDTSTIATPQYQGINQGFRPFGAKTKTGGAVRVFKHNPSISYTMRELNEYVPSESRVEPHGSKSKSSVGLAEARDKWPEWYKRRIVNKQGGQWKVNRSLYDWYKTLLPQAKFGHRYFYILHLATIGRRCSIYDEKKNPNPVTYKEVREDAYAMRGFLNGLNPDEPFTEADIKSALECFDWDLANCRIETVSKHTAIEIQRNYRRKGDSQEFHLEMARFRRHLLNKKGCGHAANAGRPPIGKERIVEYAAQHPYANKTEIAKALGISRPTVIKYLREVENG